MGEAVRHTLTGDTRPSRDDGERRNDHTPAKPVRCDHPTVKPLALMRWLVRLTKTPTGGLVLDPFAGSGTTLCACALEGRPFLACDADEHYVEIANARVAHWREVAGKEQPQLLEVT